MRKYDGSIALTTLVLVIALLFGIALSVLRSAADLGQASKAYSTNASTKILSRACLEEALFQIREDDTYIGSFGLTLNGGGCNVSVSNTVNPDEKAVSVTSNEDGYYSDSLWTVNTSTKPFRISID